MNDGVPEFWRSTAVLTGAIAAGLLMAWLVLKLQKPDPPPSAWWLQPSAYQTESAHGR